ncbi:hypothetical protein RND81_08G114700 [Saponaria officinalis]|uniref:Uncharacterized protein n=1 Tax=Saponaria officinalis TaxID=3572 RepID=A0AAW1J791_SAPOF
MIIVYFQAWARLCKCLRQDFPTYFSIETITVKDKMIGIKTGVLVEKASARNMFCCNADELEEGFFRWIDQVAEIWLPLLMYFTSMKKSDMRLFEILLVLLPTDHCQSS